MNFKRIWSGIAILLLLSACIIPFEDLIGSEGEQASETSIKEEIQDIIDVVEDPSQLSTDHSADSFSDADEALFAGETEKARSAYQKAFAESKQDEHFARALYGLGRTYFMERDYYPAIDAFNQILGQYPETQYTASAYFLLGQVYEAIEEYQQAINSYSRYIQLRPGIIDAYIHEMIGNIALLSGDFNKAIFSFQAAQTTTPEIDQTRLNLQIGKAYSGLEDYTTAIQYFDNVYGTAQDDYTRSTANLLAGQASLSLGLENEAYTYFLDSVIKYPKAYDSYTALTILVNDSIPVDDYLRGLVDYYAGSYDASVRAFQQYLDSNPDNNDGSAYYFLGLSHFFAGNPRNAITAYDSLITNFPGNSYWTSAWDEKAYVQWAFLNEYSNASDTLTSYVNSSPTSPDAPSLLFEAGRILERNDDLEGAANIWQRMMNEYPSDPQSYQALFLAGISYYRLERFDEALSVFQRTLVLSTSPDEKARAYLWAGKCYEKLKQDDDAKNAWHLGELSDPTDYYSIRNSEILNGIPPLESDKNYDLGYDLALERAEADTWLRDTFSIAKEVDLLGLDDLEDNLSVKKIKEYWDLGLYQLAMKEAEFLRTELQTDVIKTYRLMNFLIDLHIYQPAIYACRNILNMAGMDDLSSLSAPIYFTHIRFGAYFREMTLSAAAEFEIPPLLLLSLIRQESLFNPYIYSAVGASGLAQIMPATGQENADLLKWPPNYEQIDLQRGEVSVELGAFYLKRIREYLEGNLQAALAGYNAGPGSAEIWLSLSDNDPDLFLEIIRAQETKDYLMQITEFLNIYTLIYSRIQ